DRTVLVTADARRQPDPPRRARRWERTSLISCRGDPGPAHDDDAVPTAVSHRVLGSWAAARSGAIPDTGPARQSHFAIAISVTHVVALDAGVPVRVHPLRFSVRAFTAQRGAAGAQRPLWLGVQRAPRPLHR